MDDRAFASATELSNEIRDRRVGCVELLDYYLTAPSGITRPLMRSSLGELTPLASAPAPPIPPSPAASAGDHCTAFR
jgi:hypothetical protein